MVEIAASALGLAVLALVAEQWMEVDGVPHLNESPWRDGQETLFTLLMEIEYPVRGLFFSIPTSEPDIEVQLPYEPAVQRLPITTGIGKLDLPQQSVLET